MRNLLRIWGGRNKPQPPPPEGISPARRVRAVQVALIRVGIPVRLSGVMDPATRLGIRTFQRSKGLPETGFLDRETVELLKTLAKRRGRIPGPRKNEPDPPQSAGREPGDG